MRNSLLISVFLLLSCAVMVSIPKHAFAQTISENWEVHQQMEENSLLGGIKWIRLGPEFMGSRIETLEIPQDNPAIIYAGFGSGGLWKTENRGIDWTNIFPNQASFSIGDLAISNSDSDILWLGTGEQLRASRGYSYPGSGIYRSGDAGETWVNMGLKDSHHIGKIVIDPYNSNRVFVAAMGHFWSKNTERGLFYTEDGGYTWQNILYVSDSIGVTDVIWDANNSIIYACSWQIPDGKLSRVYKSKNLGESWEILNLPFKGGEKIGRIGLGQSSSWPESIYAIVDNRNPMSDENPDQIGAEVFRSNDYGISWEQTNSDPIINYGGFGWAFGDIVTHPINPDEIFILGVHLLHSKDGGRTFSKVAGKINHITQNKAISLHLDQHDFKIIPGKQDTYILGNDGGLYISYDEGNSWIHMNTIPTGEFHDIYTTGKSKVSIYGGTQDNSNIIGEINPYNYNITENHWSYVWLDPWSGGDGFTCIPDPSNPDWVFWESQNGHINKKNLLTNETVYIKPKPDEDERPLRNSWFTPFFSSKHNIRAWYYAANKVYKTMNSGESWTRVSHDLTFPLDSDKKSRSITRIAESPVKAGVIYAGTEKGAVWVSRNDGIKWFEISTGIPIKKVVSIVPSLYKVARVYIVVKGMDDDDPAPHIYVSDNYGSKWKKISGALPNIPVNCLLEDPDNEDLIYIGTDAGILCSWDSGKTWDAISLNMPTATVHKLRWMSGDDFLLAATHGQGLFYCDIRPIRRFIRSGYIDEPQYLGSINGVIPQVKDYNNDWNLNTLQPAVLTWFSPGKLETLIDLFDSNGEIVYSVEYTSTKGINQFVWDLIIEKGIDDTNYPLPKTNFPKVGNYDVQLLLGSKSIAGTIVIEEN